ncbi:pore-forming ESAT-6 family protein [Bosea vestrisii]|uniref:Pore-forming ESAT-6 family protein n=1 Tax=Bosea vestrisii TaxID=151416 RepID=A0ABW0HCH9_9HYPH
MTLSAKRHQIVTRAVRFRRARVFLPYLCRIGLEGYAGAGEAGLASADAFNLREIIMLLSFKRFSAIAALAALSSGQAFAQSQADQLAAAYQAGRNQLGVISYCAEKGHVGADVVEIQTKVLALIPPPADKSAGDAAEALGKKGTLSMMGVTQDIEAVSKAQGSTAAAFCKQLGDAVKLAASSLPK